MNALLIESSFALTSSAPGKPYHCSVVCFQDSFYIILQVPSYTFGVDQHPVSSYKFGDDSVAEGLRNMIDSSTDEDHLKGRLLSLIKNNTACVVNYADFKKVKIGGFLGTKTLKAKQNALSYVSFNATKESAKKLVKFYPDF
jgi:hypothetical protein